MKNEESVIISEDNPAKAVVDRAKYLRVASAKVFDPTVAPQVKDTLSELEAVDTISKSKVDVKSIKKNTYQIKNKGTVSSISGYKAQKLVDVDHKEDIERELLKKNSSKYSPFLVYPMGEEPPMGDIFDAQQKKSNNIFSLEYFMFPEHFEKDEIRQKYDRIKNESSDSRVFGYTKFYDNFGSFTWQRCELLDLDEKEEKFTIKWIDKFVTKKVTRANFYFEAEDRKEYFKMLGNAEKWRELCCTFMRYLDMIDKIDTPTNTLQDEIKDRITRLIMNNQYRLKGSRNPIETNRLTAKERYDCGALLRNRAILLPTKEADIVHEFSNRKYDLKYFNKLNDEINHEFVRANHQIEFDNSLPFNDQLQGMFRGYLDDDLFVPMYIKNRRPAKRFGVLLEVSQDNREQSNYLHQFSTISSITHQANLERNTVISKVNSFLFGIKDNKFVLSKFEKGYDIHTFMDNQKYASDYFFREALDKVNDVNDMLLKIVTRELTEMNARNDKKKETIQIQTLRDAALEKELPHLVVSTVKRFMHMLNFKFEYYIKEGLRESVVEYNRSFKRILDRFERMLNHEIGSFDFSQIQYSSVLDYQNHMQYQKHSEDYPVVLLKMAVVGSEIKVDSDFGKFKAVLKSVGLA